MSLTKVKPSNVDDQIIGRKNIIINGDMKVYQRAQSVTGFTSAYLYYTADRMRFSSEGGTVGTWNQEVQTDQNIGDYSNVNVLKTTCTSAGADFKRGVNYRIEPKDIKHMIGKTCTLSFYAKADATVTQQRAIAFISSGSVASSVDMGDITLTTTWTKYTATFTMANCTDYADMLLRVDGDTETSSYITLIQLELGSHATPFEFLSYGEQLNLCRRYYQRFSSGVEGSNYRFGIGCGVNPNKLDTMFQFSPQMRGVPSLDAMTAGNYRTNFNQTATSIYIVHATPSGTCVRTEHAANSVEYKGCELLCPSNFSGHTNLDAAYIAFQAEL